MPIKISLKMQQYTVRFSHEKETFSHFNCTVSGFGDCTSLIINANNAINGTIHVILIILVVH